MKKQIVLIAILCCTAFAQAQEVFVNADFVSSYIWRGIDSGNACIQPTLGLNWKGLTVYAWGSTEFRNKNNEIDLSLEYEYKNIDVQPGARINTETPAWAIDRLSILALKTGRAPVQV